MRKLRAEGDLPPAIPPKIVRPRKPKSDYRPVIAISKDLCVVEAMGEDVFHPSELPKILCAQPSSLLVVQGFGQHLERLEREFSHDSRFNYRVTPMYRYSRPWNDGRLLKQTMIQDCVCNFIGWKSDKKHIPNRYHFPLDPLWFLTTGIDDIDDRELPRIVKLYEWGKQVRDWCVENEVQIKASSGGIAAQLLRDERFYPEPRRKAPQGINRIARRALPGNYYELRAETKRSYDATYLDMNDAHHSMAARIRFPDVNSLHAYGDWSFEARNDAEKHPGGRLPRPFAPPDSGLLDKPGLFHLQVSVPHIPRHHFPPPYLEMGVQDIYLYSNEIEWVKSFGVEITAIHSAYVSDGYETGLNKYAKWAINEIRANRECKPWLKPTLLSTYGLLAARPVVFETGYYRAKGGTWTEYPMGNVSVMARVKKNSKAIESRIANVIHRGMIEAEVRKEALWFARHLTEVNRREVLAIYADAIFIRSRIDQDKSGKVIPDLPLLQPPWRVSKHVSGLRFLSAVHFTSPSISRLPGVPRTARERYLQQQALAQELSVRAPR